METKFQTSFIPKKQIVQIGGAGSPPRHRSTSFFMGLATIVFVLSLVAVGGAYGWEQYLMSEQNAEKSQLATREQQFNVDLIEQLKQANVQIDYAKQLLQNHLALSEIFGILSRLTIQSVRFLSLDITAPSAPGGDVKVDLDGYGTSFSAVAFQSDVLGSLEDYGLRKVVINPILSDPALNANGTVSFGFTASIDPSSISYEQSVAPAASSTAASASASATGSASSAGSPASPNASASTGQSAPAASSPFNQ